jgi:ubiquitin C-terminal hydrolase
MKPSNGKIGLINRGNTCFFNASIQALSNIVPLTEYFLKNDYEQDLGNRLNNEKKKHEINKINVEKIILAREYAKLIKVLWSSDLKSIEPRSLHTCLQNYEPTFQGLQQQDAQECLSYILDSLHEGLHYDITLEPSGTIENELDKLMVESIKIWSKEVSKKYSIITDLFFGQFYIQTISNDDSYKKNEVVSIKYELFNILNIQVVGITLYDCLNHFFSKEKIDTPIILDNKKTIVASRKFNIIKIPQYIIIVLKRFSSMNYLSKINNIITFPIDDLDLSEYCVGYEKYYSKLSLKSVILHSGSLNGGHYYSYCKHIDNNWYEYNDSSCTKIDIEASKNILFRNGYILIYEKKEDE